MNVEQQLQDQNSVLNFYKDLIRLRQNNEQLRAGDIEIKDTENNDVFYYVRGAANKIHVYLNFGPLTRVKMVEGKVLLLS